MQMFCEPLLSFRSALAPTAMQSVAVVSVSAALYPTATLLVLMNGAPLKCCNACAPTAVLPLLCVNAESAVLPNALLKVPEAFAASAPSTMLFGSGPTITGSARNCWKNARRFMMAPLGRVPAVACDDGVIVEVKVSESNHRTRTQRDIAQIERGRAGVETHEECAPR